jgi:hypothetical protein
VDPVLEALQAFHDRGVVPFNYTRSGLPPG